MKSALCDEDGVSLDPVNETMLACDSPRPVTGPFVAQRLGFANPCEGVLQDVLYQPLDLDQNAAIAMSPIPSIPLCLGGPVDLPLRRLFAGAGQSPSRSRRERIATAARWPWNSSGAPSLDVSARTGAAHPPPARTHPGPIWRQSSPIHGEAWGAHEGWCSWRRNSSTRAPCSPNVSPLGAVATIP